MICQKQEIVPLILLQLPWREKGDHVSSEYFKHAVESFASALKSLKVDLQGLLFETRPPMTISAQEEKGLSGTARESLGLEIGRQMFEIIDQAFDGDAIAGFCVAGGSTKGDLPLAMEDDTQNAVRQGMRQRARRRWGYEACFWEMGAKLMLQPKVGRLWGQSQAGRDAGRDAGLQLAGQAECMARAATTSVNWCFQLALCSVYRVLASEARMAEAAVLQPRFTLCSSTSTTGGPLRYSSSEL